MIYNTDETMIEVPTIMNPSFFEKTLALKLIDFLQELQT